MTHVSRPFAVERSALPPRYAVRADRLDQLRVVVATMRDVPRASTASMADMLFLLRRLAGTLDQVARDLQPVEQAPQRIAYRAAGLDPRRTADAAFKTTTLPPAREQRREILSKGRRVRVVERGRCPGQLEFTL